MFWVIITISAFILTGLNWGYVEGIVMYNPNPRLHKFFSVYHLLSLTRTFWIVFTFYITMTHFYNCWYIYSGFIFMWEASELGYKSSRYDISGWYEHITILDFIEINMESWEVIVLHVLRNILAITLLLKGLFYA